MLPVDKGGVVDPTLTVHGTNNLRVVDLSIVPLHIGAHPQGTPPERNLSASLLLCALRSHRVRDCRARSVPPRVSALDNC